MVKENVYLMKITESNLMRKLITNADLLHQVHFNFAKPTNFALKLMEIFLKMLFINIKLFCFKKVYLLTMYPDFMDTLYNSS